MTDPWRLGHGAEVGGTVPVVPVAGVGVGACVEVAGAEGVWLSVGVPDDVLGAGELGTGLPVGDVVPPDGAGVDGAEDPPPLAGPTRLGLRTG